MKKYIIYIISFVVVALLQISCYDDKGDYDYHEVNSMEVKIPETKLRMPKDEAVEVSIVPEISQTLEQNEANLVFQWKKTKKGVKAGSERMIDYEDYSVGKECKITVEPYESENIGLMVVVTDRKNGTTWYQTGEVAIIRPLNPCWFILQEKEESGILGAIEGTPEGYYVYSDVFKSELNQAFPLSGKPLAVSARKNYGNSKLKDMLSFLGFKVIPALMLVTDCDLSLFTPSTLKPIYRSDKILFEPVNKGESLKIEFYKMSTHGELFVNNGKAYCAFMDAFCVPYSVKSGNEYPAISAFGSYKGGLLFFDKVNHCFLNASLPGTFDYMGNQATQNIRKFGTPWSDQKPVSIYSMEDDANVFDPDAIDPSLQVKDIITGGSYGNYSYAITAPFNGKELTVFKFSADWENEDPTCAAKYTIAVPSEVDVETAKFAASYAYTANIIFMASGNKLYRINLDRGQVTELYAYEVDSSAQIASLKFKDPESVREENDGEAEGEYKEKLGMCLGLGINTGEKGVVVEIQLTMAGDISREERSICVYEDPNQPIGKIVDITYNYE